MGKKDLETYCSRYVIGMFICMLQVGETEKIDIMGNVGTANFPRNVGTVSLMLFSSPKTPKRALALSKCRLVQKTAKTENLFS